MSMFSGAQGQKVTGIIFIRHWGHKLFAADQLAFNNDIKSISELCLPCFTKGMMVTVIVGKVKINPGLWAAGRPSITDVN